MKVREVFKNWHRPGKAEDLAEFFGEDVLDREVVERSKRYGVGVEGAEILLTVHKIVFDGSPVPRRVRPETRETWIDGNILAFPT